jgi:hypothetical protein
VAAGLRRCQRGDGEQGGESYRRTSSVARIRGR